MLRFDWRIVSAACVAAALSGVVQQPALAAQVEFGDTVSDFTPESIEPNGVLLAAANVIIVNGAAVDVQAPAATAPAAPNTPVAPNAPAPANAPSAPVGAVPKPVAEAPAGKVKGDLQVRVGGGIGQLLQLQVQLGDAIGVNAAPAVDAERPKLSPEAEKEMAGLMDKLKEAKNKVWVERMAKEVEEMDKSVELTEAEKKALEAPSKKAIENCLVMWLDKMDAMLRKTIQRQPRVLPQLFNQYRQMADNYAENDIVPGVKHPMDNPAWIAGFQGVLTPPHLEKWTKVIADRRTKAKEELKEVLKPMEDRAREQFASAIALKAAEIKDTLKLPPDRGAALDELGKKAVDQSMVAWNNRAETTITAMSGLRRKTMLQGRLFVGPDPLELPELQPAWKEGVAKLLGAEEAGRLTQIKAEHRARRARMMAQLFLLYVDEKVALTAAQREKLVPMAEQLVQKQSALFPPEGEERDNFLSPQLILSAGANAPEKEVRAIISDDQWEHWKKYCTGQVADDFNMPVQVEEPKESATTPGAAVTASDVEPVEQAISNFMAAKAIKQRQRMVSTLLLQAEDAARVASIPPAAYQRLQTAARGATERSLQAWKVQFEQIVRGNLNEVTASTLKQRLAGLENFNSFQVPGDKPQQQALWKKSVETELTAEQRVAWQKEVDARKLYREKTIIGTVLAEFDRQIPLRKDQWDKLEELLIKITGEYSDEISTFFSFNEGSAWYLQSYTRFMPLAGLPEEDLKQLLGKEQWDRWTKTDEYTNAKNYWNNIKQNHQNRRR